MKILYVRDRQWHFVWKRVSLVYLSFCHFFFYFCLIIGKALLVTSAELYCFSLLSAWNNLELEYLQIILVYPSSLYNSFYSNFKIEFHTKRKRKQQ